MEPLVSIVMPNYNGQEYISEAIQSVLAQSYGNFELIIVDDCSTDDSVNIINSFNDSRIRLIKKDRNEQICIALNRGLREAAGSYIARIDSDDRWKPDKLNKQVELLENHDEYGACFTWADIIDAAGNIINDTEQFYGIFHQENRTRPEWVKRLVLQGNCLCHSSVVFRKELLDGLKGYKNTLVQLQDYDMWLRLLKLSGIYVLEEELTDYRRIAGSDKCISSSGEGNDTRCYNETVYILRDYLDDMDDLMFSAGFRDLFINKDSATPEELKCEKAFILYGNGRMSAGREAGIIKLMDLSEDENFRTLLEQKFSFSIHDFYKLNRKHYYFDYILRNNNDIDMDVVPAVYYSLKEEPDKVCEVKQKVKLNRGVLKCRFSIPENAGAIRFDPLDDRYAIVTGFNAVSSGMKLTACPINGKVMEDTWVFNTRDPQIMLKADDSFNGTIDIEAKVITLDSEAFGKAVSGIDIYAEKSAGLVLEKDAQISRQKDELEADANLINAKDNHINNLEMIIRERELQVSSLERTIKEMENTKIWRLYRKIKKK